MTLLGLLPSLLLSSSCSLSSRQRTQNTATLPAPGLPTCRSSAWRTRLLREGPTALSSSRALLGGHLFPTTPYRCPGLHDVPPAPALEQTWESKTLSWEISKTLAPKTLKKEECSGCFSRMDKLMNQLAKYPKRMLCRIRKIITRLDVNNTRTLDGNSQVPPWTH